MPVAVVGPLLRIPDSLQNCAMCRLPRRKCGQADAQRYGCLKPSLRGPPVVLNPARRDATVTHPKTMNMTEQLIPFCQTGKRL